MSFSVRRLLAVVFKELRHITRDVRIFFLVTLSPAFLLLVLAYIFAFDVSNVSLGWLDGDRGQIEPLGCHPAYRHYALGRLALAEALRRLNALGAARLHVETDNWRDTARLLYEHMGFQVTRQVLVFRKDF